MPAATATSRSRARKDLQHFGLAADDADDFFRPQPVDEPALLFRAIGEAMSRLDRKLSHRRTGSLSAAPPGPADAQAERGKHNRRYSCTNAVCGGVAVRTNPRCLIG
jgi:hypothetical protein